MSSSIRGTNRATLLTSPAIGANDGNGPPRGMVNGCHAALMVKFTHVLGPPCGVGPTLVGELPVRTQRPRSVSLGQPSQAL